MSSIGLSGPLRPNPRLDLDEDVVVFAQNQVEFPLAHGVFVLHECEATPQWIAQRHFSPCAR
jgi:hypothetical protein